MQSACDTCQLRNGCHEVGIIICANRFACLKKCGVGYLQIMCSYCFQGSILRGGRLEHLMLAFAPLITRCQECLRSFLCSRVVYTFKHDNIQVEGGTQSLRASLFESNYHFFQIRMIEAQYCPGIAYIGINKRELSDNIRPRRATGRRHEVTLYFSSSQ